MADQTDQYFESFSAYLGSGDLEHLHSVFPQAGDLSFAAVYRNGYLNNCIEALRASYPVIDMLIGEDYFNFLATAYVELKPPSESSFTRYGDTFPAFIEAQKAQHQIAYLADVAILDQAWLAAYFAADSMLLGVSDIEQWQAQGNDIGALVACLPESASIHTVNHAVSALWSMLKSGETPGQGMVVEPLAESILVWRDTQDRVNVRVLSNAERVFVMALKTGGSFAAAAGEALALQTDFAFIEFFSELLERDLLAVK